MRWLALIGCLATALPALAAEAPTTLSLEEAQQMALKHHPEVLASDFRTGAAGENTKVVRSGYLPQVGGNAVSAFADDNTRLAASGGLNNPTVIDRTSYGLNASQLITDFGRTHQQIEAAKAQEDAAASRALSAREQVLFGVTRSYYNVLRAQKVMEVAQATHQARQSLLDQIGAMRDAKLRSDLDLSMARQSVSEADLLMLRAKNDLDNARAELSQALGFSEEKDYVLEDKPVVVQPQDDLSLLLTEAKAQNPQLQAMKSELEATRAQQRADQAAHYPTVSAVGYAGESSLRNSGIDSNYAAGGVLISMPFYTGGKLTATEHRTAYEARALEQDMADKENNLEREVREDWNNMQVAYQNISVTGKLRDTANEVLELTRERYKLGKNSIVDLAQAQLGQTEAAIANANAKYDYLTQEALLDYATGKKLVNH